MSLVRQMGGRGVGLIIKPRPDPTSTAFFCATPKILARVPSIAQSCRWGVLWTVHGELAKRSGMGQQALLV